MEDELESSTTVNIQHSKYMSISNNVLKSFHDQKQLHEKMKEFHEITHLKREYELGQKKKTYVTKFL